MPSLQRVQARTYTFVYVASLQGVPARTFAFAYALVAGLQRVRGHAYALVAGLQQVPACAFAFVAGLPWVPACDNAFIASLQCASAHVPIQCVSDHAPSASFQSPFVFVLATDLQSAFVFGPQNAYVFVFVAGL